MKQLLLLSVITLSITTVIEGRLGKRNKYVMYRNETESPLVKLYNKLGLSEGSERHLTKPVGANSSLVVRLGLTLISLIDLNEIEQTMTTNVWVYQEWQDPELAWIAAEFGDIRKIDVPATLVWIPDIVLYNSADGTYAMPLKLRVTIESNGTIRWEPPVIWKSSCKINIQYFPFDQQTCSMKFGTWSYDGNQVNLLHRNQTHAIGSVQQIPNAIDSTSNYRESVEWDILQLSAKRSVNTYACCPDPYIDVTFYVCIERKALFYTVNVLFPIFIISCLSVFVFYLPADSGEKMSLSVSVLVSLIMFFLVLFEKIPATSFVIPLMAKFLLFTMILVTLSVILNVIVIRIHWQALYYKQMPYWIRNLFLTILAPLMLSKTEKDRYTRMQIAHFNQSIKQLPASPITSFRSAPFRSKMNHDMRDLASTVNLTYEEHELINEFTRNVNILYQCLAKKFDFKQNQREWRVVAMIIDRVFLYIFMSAFVFGSICILFSGVLQSMSSDKTLKCESNQ